MRCVGHFGRWPVSVWKVYYTLLYTVHNTLNGKAIRITTVYKLLLLSPDCRYEKKISTTREEKNSDKGRVKGWGVVVMVGGGLLASWPDGHQEGPDSCVCVGFCMCVCRREREGEIETDCVQHLSSLDTTTKEKTLNMGCIKHRGKQNEGERRTE